MLPFVSMDQHHTGSHVAAGAVTGTVQQRGNLRIIVITANEGWTGPDWDQVAKALNAGDDWIDNDYRILEDDREEWRIVYRRGDSE